MDMAKKSDNWAEGFLTRALVSNDPGVREAVRERVARGEWNEADHPRDGGKFAPKGGAAGAKDDSGSKGGGAIHKSSIDVLKYVESRVGDSTVKKASREFGSDVVEGLIKSGHLKATDMVSDDGVPYRQLETTKAGREVMYGTDKAAAAVAATALDPRRPTTR